MYLYRMHGMWYLISEPTNNINFQKDRYFLIAFEYLVYQGFIDSQLKFTIKVDFKLLVLVANIHF